jgi:hypothetical protein
MNMHLSVRSSGEAWLKQIENLVSAERGNLFRKLVCVQISSVTTVAYMIMHQDSAGAQLCHPVSPLRNVCTCRRRSWRSIALLHAPCFNHPSSHWNYCNVLPRESFHCRSGVFGTCKLLIAMIISSTVCERQLGYYCCCCCLTFK